MITTSASRVISTLRLPLIIGVVFIHSSVPLDQPTLIETKIWTIFGYVLPAFCVPLFFMFSGYLFFATTKAFTPKEYAIKLKSRSKSLLIPYIVWNALTLLAFYVFNRLVPSSRSHSMHNVVDYSFIDILSAFWIDYDYYPIALQFWFIRDLMVVILLSPIVYLIVKKTPIGILVFTVLYFIIPRFAAAYFFSLGAYFALQNKDFIALSYKIRWYAITVFAVSLIVRAFTVDRTSPDTDLPYIKEVYILSSMIVVLVLTDKLSCKYQVPTLFTNSSFFIFCSHILIGAVISRIITSFLAGRNEIFWIIGYFANPFIIVALGILLYKLLSLYTPRLLSFITGGR